jgi:hypothetical protein
MPNSFLFNQNRKISENLNSYHFIQLKIFELILLFFKLTYFFVYHQNFQNRFIKIVGVRNTANRIFHLVSMEVRYTLDKYDLFNDLIGIFYIFIFFQTKNFSY